MSFVDAFDWILDFNLKGNRRNQNPGTYQRSTEYDSTFISFKDILYRAHTITMANQGIRYFSTRGGDDTLTFEEVRTRETDFESS